MVSYCIKFFLSAIILLLGISLCKGQSNDPDVEWYESFFQQKENVPTGKVLDRNEKILIEAQENHDLKAKAQALNERGLIYLTRMVDYDQAIDLFNKALAIEDSLGLKTKQIFTYVGIARVFEEAENFDRSAEFLDQAMKINEDVNNKNILVFILNRLGKVCTA